MPLLSFERANQWVPLDFMLKTDKMKLPLHEFSFVKATAPLALCDSIAPLETVERTVQQKTIILSGVV